VFFEFVEPTVKFRSKGGTQVALKFIFLNADQQFVRNALALANAEFLCCFQDLDGRHSSLVASGQERVYHAAAPNSIRRREPNPESKIKNQSSQSFSLSLRGR
jgi:hypothetical protein